MAAREYGLALPRFGGAGDAERALLTERDTYLGKLSAISKGTDTFVAGYSPESLKSLERWYFELAEGDGFAKLRVD